MVKHKNLKENWENDYDQGYVKIFRGLISDWVFANPVGLKIWIWCLLKASFKCRYVPVKIWKGNTTVELNPGQFIFGRHKAEDVLNIKSSTVYNWMKKFQEKNMINLDSNNNYTIVTICNWGYYQLDQTDNLTTNKQPNNNSQTANEQLFSTDKNVNNENNVIEVNNDQDSNKFSLDSQNISETSKKKEEMDKSLSKRIKPVLDKLDLVDLIIREFKESYLQEHGQAYEIISAGKERNHAGKILKIYKSQFPTADTDETVKGLRDYFDKCVSIADGWLHDSMSLGIIVSQFNKINKILNHGKSSNKKGATDRGIAEHFARKWANE